MNKKEKFLDNISTIIEALIIGFSGIAIFDVIKSRNDRKEIKNADYGRYPYESDESKES